MALDKEARVGDTSQIVAEVDTFRAFDSLAIENAGIPNGWTKIKFDDLTLSVENIEMG
jgi:hypothetical protein